MLHVIAEHDILCCGIALRLVQDTCLVVFPHILLCTHQLFTKEQSEKKEMALTSCTLFSKS